MDNLTEEQKNRFMSLAIAQAWQGVKNGEGGPFGACIIETTTFKVVSQAHNTVLKDNDPSAHAEINAIRQACRKKNSYWLEDCVLFTTCEPCPMCLGAIYWSRIPVVYFGCSRQEASDAGFDDKFIYEQIFLPIEQRSIKFISSKDTQNCLEVMLYWKSLNSKKVY